ncbi:GGDEF domain-containing response regulator [Pleurocapsa sp. CCALA 161]|uniref:putative bifunctional diguanylate cyclase/phosphodiesterase n=1 Tax=Pleurocapsa sp. CCALA 161 TaxID=2107688 RepID=UPI000D0542FE|nr:EAL domain-containing protein [Pleurocapsa sp. CCALA 161]PSB11405.1 GGDEF domain-containing response regulator [Pleurocapsa sp. CCALA 161]
MSKLLRVLIIEDSEDDAELLAITLRRGGYQVIDQRVDTKTDLEIALSTQPWDIVLADYSMPQFSAIAALEILKERGLDLPFVIISGKIGEDTAVAAMKAGAHDYLIKGQLSRLLPAVERELREAIFREEYRAAQKRLRYLAYYDKLTNLPNRISFLDHLNSEIAQEQKELNSTQIFAVLLLSIDRFHSIKRSLGYEISDKLLIAIARRLENYVVNINANVIARIGEDEFALLISKLNNQYEVVDQAEDLYHELIKPFEINGATVCSTVSIGISLNQENNREPEKMLRWADTAMQYAKVNFAKTSVLFDETMQSQAVEKLRLENDLQRAIDNHQLYLNYQPIVSLDTGKIHCLEALVRWKHDSLGTISPNKFIPICEETGQIIALGQWVLSEACSQLVTWQESFVGDSPLTVSVNLSRIQIYHPELIPQIDNLLESLNLNGQDLKLEITESTLMENTSAVTKVLEQLKEREIKLCLDDFGTGYSSLNYLRYLPVDTVKIDRSFIGPEINNTNYDIIKAIINLAHSLGLDVVAEGIETAAQLKILKNLGCEYGQGYLFAPALNATDVMDIL